MPIDFLTVYFLIFHIKIIMNDPASSHLNVIPHVVEWTVFNQQHNALLLRHYIFIWDVLSNLLLSDGSLSFNVIKNVFILILNANQWHHCLTRTKMHYQDHCKCSMKCITYSCMLVCRKQINIEDEGLRISMILIMLVNEHNF